MTIVHLSPSLLLFTGVFEFYTAMKQSSALNNWIFKAATIQIIFIAMIDVMICSVFWLIASDFEKTQNKIRASSKTGTEDSLE